MEWWLRPAVHRWVLVALVVATVLLNLVNWPAGGGVAFLVNVIVGVASGYGIFGLVLVFAAMADRARSRRRTPA